jgi:hypothetical protein
MTKKKLLKNQYRLHFMSKNLQIILVKTYSSSRAFQQYQEHAQIPL